MNNKRILKRLFDLLIKQNLKKSTISMPFYKYAEIAFANRAKPFVDMVTKTIVVCFRFNIFWQGIPKTWPKDS